MIVRFDNKALKQRKTESTIGVEGDPLSSKGAVSEADALVSQAKKRVDGVDEGSIKANAETIVEGEESMPGPVMDINPVRARFKSN